MSLGEIRYGNELIWTVMYKFELSSNGARGDCWFTDGGLMGELELARGIGFGDGKFCAVVSARRIPNGTTLNHNRQLTVPTRMHLGSLDTQLSN